jgi:hypothetical protein
VSRDEHALLSRDFFDQQLSGSFICRPIVCPSVFACSVFLQRQCEQHRVSVCPSTEMKVCMIARKHCQRFSLPFRFSGGQTVRCHARTSQELYLGVCPCSWIVGDANRERERSHCARLHEQYDSYRRQSAIINRETRSDPAREAVRNMWMVQLK